MTENKLKSLIQEEIKVSMKKGDKEKTTTLRMAISEIQKEEEALKVMQEELGSQRSILPPDEFSLLESNFRKRVENLQKMVAEKNQLLENILSRSVQVIQGAAINIITEIGREKGLALTLDTSSVVIAANSINISKTVIELLNINLPEVNMDNIINQDK